MCVLSMCYYKWDEGGVIISVTRGCVVDHRPVGIWLVLIRGRGHVRGLLGRKSSL